MPPTDTSPFFLETCPVLAVGMLNDFQDFALVLAVTFGVVGSEYCTTPEAVNRVDLSMIGTCAGLTEFFG